MPGIAFAIMAHPDDIEFVAAGTLLKLKEAGWETHYMNLSAGDCGSMEYSPQETAAVRAREAKNASAILGATWHQPLCRDLMIFYNEETLRRLAAVVRHVNPDIVLTHSPEDYMEDHMNTSRLAVTAAFSRGMPNFGTNPPTPATSGKDVTVYHAMPHGLKNALRRRVEAGSWVNTGSVHDTKRAALEAHTSQKDWLDKTQGMDSYLVALDEMSVEVAQASGRFRHAEGWRRHSHLGFSGKEIDPLKEALGEDYLVNEEYEEWLKGEGR